MKFCCDNCGCNDTYTKLYSQNCKVKNKIIKFNSMRRFCSNCNKLVYDYELDNDALKKSIYNYNILFSNENNELSEYNGYSFLSKDKIINLVKILCDESIHKTKLLKEIFYVDFYSYKMYYHSVTGLEYTKIAHGSVPDGFEAILEKLSQEKIISYEVCYHDDYEENLITNNDKIDYSVFSEDELNLIISVKEKFISYKVKDIVEYFY